MGFGLVERTPFLFPAIFVSLKLALARPSFSFLTAERLLRSEFAAVNEPGLAVFVVFVVDFFEGIRIDVDRFEIAANVPIAIAR